jgi:hypothetical protein
MLSSGMFRPVALVRTDVPQERSASIIRVTSVGELGTMLAETSSDAHNVITRKPAFFTMYLVIAEFLLPD